MNTRYTEHAQHRHLEPGHPADRTTPQRTPFAIDRDRIKAASAFERLAGVTQIDEPRPGCLPHHRRAHSLAVARLGRHMAEKLGADADLVEAACLAHDLGHPPFGHDGERALAMVAADCGGFEANAQTLRILTRLAPLAPDRAPDGLHLTRATLDATCKYPWPSATAAGKFGAYPDDLTTLIWLREDAPSTRRCVEAQIMDWADDVANAVHDLEYGIRTHRIPPTALTDRSDRAALAGLAASDVTRLPLDTVLAAADDLAALPVLRSAVDLTENNDAQFNTKLATLRTQLCRRYIGPIIDTSVARYGDTVLTRYTGDLQIPAWVRAEVALLTALTLRYLLRTPDNRRRRARRMELLTELAEHLISRAPDALDPVLLQPTWVSPAGHNGYLRVVVDQIAALTDAQAASFTSHGR